MNKIKERENKWDITIYDFIMQNYKRHKLFYDMGHPTNIVLKKIAEDVLERLGIKETNIDAQKKLDIHEVPVYPCRKKSLGLEWEDENIRKSDYACRMGENMDLESYVREYVWWCKKNNCMGISKC